LVSRKQIYNQYYTIVELTSTKTVYNIDITILASRANLLEGLYILLALISLFFKDHPETNYLRIRWTDFRDLFTK